MTRTGRLSLLLPRRRASSDVERRARCCAAAGSANAHTPTASSAATAGRLPTRNVNSECNTVPPHGVAATNSAPAPLLRYARPVPVRGMGDPGDFSVKSLETINSVVQRRTRLSSRRLRFPSTRRSELKFVGQASSRVVPDPTQVHEKKHNTFLVQLSEAHSQDVQLERVPLNIPESRHVPPAPMAGPCGPACVLSGCSGRPALIGRRAPDRRHPGGSQELQSTRLSQRGRKPDHAADAGDARSSQPCERRCSSLASLATGRWGRTAAPGRSSSGKVCSSPTAWRSAPPTSCSPCKALYDARVGSFLASGFLINGRPITASAPDDHTVVIVFPAVYGPGLSIFDSLPILPGAQVGRRSRGRHVRRGLEREHRPGRGRGARSLFAGRVSARPGAALHPQPPLLEAR